VLAVGIDTPGARADSAYDGFAKAVGVLATLENPSIPAGLVITGGGPEADAHQGSVGVGDANAAMPYFGDTVPGLPGTGAGIVGLPAPPYPLIASTNRGSAPVTTSYPGFALRAESNDFSTVGSASAGQDLRAAVAEARVEDLRDGSVAATAESESRALSLGGVLQLRNVRSFASAVADGASGEVRRTSSLSIGELTIPGASFTIPNNTPGHAFFPNPIPGAPPIPSMDFPTMPLPAGGQTLVVPRVGFVDGYFTAALPGGGDQQYLVPAEPILKSFEAAGLKVSYQAAQQTKSGVIAPNLVFSTVLPAPPPNTYVNGATPVRYSVGEAVAQVDLQPFDAVAGGATTNGLPGATGPAGLNPGTPVDAVALPGASLGAVGIPSVNLVPATPTASDNTVAASESQRLIPFDTSNIYLALVGAAVLAFFTATALSVMGVRQWTS
jgi:hypothetical protein